MMALVTTKYPDGFSSSVKSLTIVGKRKVDWRAEETYTKIHLGRIYPAMTGCVKMM